MNMDLKEHCDPYFHMPYGPKKDNSPHVSLNTVCLIKDNIINLVFIIA